ncbi:hypothetical protein LH128_01232 [Sphingomonas sp. LH128]|uniref:hypothetical protein n=1 Tax=Sphingomonas sp. LH128 TaxID=473781 RepID=UPI00027CC488|nr:hypothetical protein [Sphingomonas sp. LH128]EJU14956.1 hypothetical protein LH128_01232 [Sphingomonas sp. LH128]
MGQVETITNFAPNLGAPAVSPVARHVALMRQDWRNKLSEYYDAEEADVSQLPEAEQDAAFDRAGAALDDLVGVRAADLAILAEKMRIVDKTGTVLATGYFKHLLDDVEGLSKRAVFVPTKADIFAAIKRGLKKIEPWFDWGRCERTRLDSKCAHFTDESWGQVHRFDLQWLGVHFAIELGRTPAKVTLAEAERRRARYNALTTPVADRECATCSAATETRLTPCDECGSLDGEA